MLFGHNTLYFAQSQRLAFGQGIRVLVRDHAQGLSELGSGPRLLRHRQLQGRGGESLQGEKAAPGRPRNDVIGAIEGLQIDRPGGKGGWRKDHIADQTFVQGFTTQRQTNTTS